MPNLQHFRSRNKGKKMENFRKTSGHLKRFLFMVLEVYDE